MPSPETVETDTELSEALAVIDRAETAIAKPIDEVTKHRDCALLYVASLQSETSRMTARTALRKIARELGVSRGKNDPDAWLRVPWASLGARETGFVQACLVKKCAPATARVTMAMLRGVLKQAKRLGHMSGDVYLNAIDTGRIRGSTEPKGRMLENDEIDQLFGYIDGLPSPFNLMVRALFAVAITGGLRREELSTLKVDSLRPQEGILVKGKGNKQVVQPLPEWTREACVRWIDARAKLVKPGATDVLFAGLSSSGAASSNSRGLDPRAIWRLMHAIGKESGVAHFTPHDLRRTFISILLENHPTSIVQKLARHNNPSTTAGYDRRPMSVAVDAMNQTFGAERGGKAPRVSKFKKRGKPVEATWVRSQVDALLERGMSTTQAAAALAKIGVTWGSRPIEAGDLR